MQWSSLHTTILYLLERFISASKEITVNSAPHSLKRGKDRFSCLKLSRHSWGRAGAGGGSASGGFFSSSFWSHEWVKSTQYSVPQNIFEWHFEISSIRHLWVLSLKERNKQTKTFETKRTRGNEVWSLTLTCKPCSARISYPWVSKSEPQRIPVLLKSSNAIYQVASPLKRVLFREPSLVYCSLQNDELTIFLLFFFFSTFLENLGCRNAIKTFTSHRESAWC